MKLTFVRPHLSIARLPIETLPRLAVLTGLNGSGKTHFLRAIQNGSIATDVATKDGMTLLSHDLQLHADTVDSTVRRASRGKFLQILDHGRREAEHDLRQAIFRHWPGVADARFDSLWDILRLPTEESSRLVGGPEVLAAIEKSAEHLMNTLVRRVAEQNGRDAEALKDWQALRSRLGLKVALARSFSDDAGVFQVEQPQMFSPALGRTFMGYFELWKNNGFARMQPQPWNPPLTDDEFVRTYGPEPWGLVNETFRDAGLDFEVNHPSQIDETVFTPRLRKRSSGVSVDFGYLSSGERVLMSLALCLYCAEDKRQHVSIPKLVLLDEADASLHPSMCRQMIHVITRVFVEKYGIHVILATHSSSTIAVAPEDSVYVMKAEGPSIEKASRRQALVALTAGIPTLAISFDGRRQVFVEDDSDAERFQALYYILEPFLASERSLVFIGAGVRTDAGTHGAGCAQVAKAVNALATAGNESVYGLLDWDLDKIPESRVKVLAHGERYAVENCLLDPLLVVVALARLGAKGRELLGMGAHQAPAELKTMEPGELQLLVNNVQAVMFGCTCDRIPEPIQVKYRGGLQLHVSKLWLTKNGHELEAAVKEKFAMLKKPHHSEGGLLRHMVESVCVEFPEFVPAVVFDAFKQLLGDTG